MTERDPTKTVFVLDELYQYRKGVDESVSRIYATGRKWGLSVISCVTSLNQLEKCFPDTHQDVLNNSGAIQILGSSDPQGTNFVQNMAGQQTVVSTSRSVSRGDGGNGQSRDSSSTSYSSLGVPVIRSQEVRGIGTGKQIVLLDELPHVILADTKGYFEVPHLRKRAGVNPFFAETRAKAKGEPQQEIDEVAILLKEYGF